MLLSNGSAQICKLNRIYDISIPMCPYLSIFIHIHSYSFLHWSIYLFVYLYLDPSVPPFPPSCRRTTTSCSPGRAGMVLVFSQPLALRQSNMAMENGPFISIGDFPLITSIHFGDFPAHHAWLLEGRQPLATAYSHCPGMLLWRRCSRVDKDARKRSDPPPSVAWAWDFRVGERRLQLTFSGRGIWAAKTYDPAAESSSCSSLILKNTCWSRLFFVGRPSTCPKPVYGKRQKLSWGKWWEATRFGDSKHSNMQWFFLQKTGDNPEFMAISDTVPILLHGIGLRNQAFSCYKTIQIVWGSQCRSSHRSRKMSKLRRQKKCYPPLSLYLSQPDTSCCQVVSTKSVGFPPVRLKEIPTVQIWWTRLQFLQIALGQRSPWMWSSDFCPAQPLEFSKYPKPSWFSTLFTGSQACCTDNICWYVEVFGSHLPDAKFS